MGLQPTTIGRYRLVRRLGAGGMGIVYEALDERDGSRVALKVLLPHAAEEREGLLRFKREFRALARLRHPNIVRVFDAGIEDDVPFIAMEFVEGRDVRRHLRAIPDGPSRDGEMKRCLLQIFGALAHIHARRIVHRDLKPENILVSPDGRVKLMDFGVALYAREPESDSELLGTYAYMAPEQVTTGEIDGRSDLYAIGVLMYEILTGSYPFPVEPPAAALHHHVHTPPESIRQRVPAADASLAALAHRLLEKDPLDRIQSAEEAFRYLAEQESIEPSAPISPPQLFAPRCVGRVEELRRLEELAGQAAEGKGAILLIEGPSGIGKSRLIRELSKRVRRKLHVLAGQCAPERATAYGPIQAVLDEIATIAGRSSTEVVQRIVGQEASLIHTISPKLARVSGASTGGTAAVSERRVRLHKAVVGVIGRLALSRPVLLVVEDVHWADSSTLELLWDASRTLLARRPQGGPGETVCPVLLILTRRSLAEGPDASEQLIRRLDERRRLQRMTVGPIDAAGITEMLRTMTGVAHPGTEAVEELEKSAQGRPLLVQDMVQGWVAQGVLVRRDGEWFFRDRPFLTPSLAAGEVSSRAEADVPSAPTPRPSVAGAANGGLPHRKSSRPSALADGPMLARLERLDGVAKRLLQHLALLGRLLPGDLVSALAEPDETAFLDAMDELVREGLLVEDVSHGSVRYRFYHEGFREAVVRAIPTEQRAEMHLHVARVLERRFWHRRAEFAHVLARHYRGGGSPLRAIRYLRMQAQAAAERGDLEAAMRRLSEALGILDEGPRTPASTTRRLKVLVQQIDLLLDFGRPREALDRADPAAAHDARSPWAMAAELSLRRAASQFALGQFDGALETLSRLDGKVPSRSIGARSLELEARTEIARGEYTKARAVLEAARDIARASGLLDLADDLDAKIGIVLVHQGDNLAALGRLERGLDRARQRGDSRALAEILGHIGLVQVSRGQNSAAVACFREAIELAEARGVRAELERWSGELGMLMSALGDAAGAEHQLNLALELARESGNRQGEATWRGELGIHYVSAARYDKASSELKRSLAIAKDIGFTLYEGWCHAYLGVLAIERDLSSFDAARVHIDAALEIADALGNQELRVIGMVQLAKLRRAQGDERSALAVAESVDDLASASPNLRRKAKVCREIDALFAEG